MLHDYVQLKFDCKVGALSRSQNRLRKVHGKDGDDDQSWWRSPNVVRQQCRWAARVELKATLRTGRKVRRPRRTEGAGGQRA